MDGRSKIFSQRGTRLDWLGKTVHIILVGEMEPANHAANLQHREDGQLKWISTYGVGNFQLNPISSVNHESLKLLGHNGAHRPAKCLLKKFDREELELLLSIKCSFPAVGRSVLIIFLSTSLQKVYLFSIPKWSKTRSNGLYTYWQQLWVLNWPSC